MDNDVTIELKMITDELMSLVGNNSAEAQARRELLIKAKERILNYGR